MLYAVAFRIVPQRGTVARGYQRFAATYCLGYKIPLDINTGDITWYLHSIHNSNKSKSEDGTKLRALRHFKKREKVKIKQFPLTIWVGAGGIALGEPEVSSLLWKYQVKLENMKREVNVLLYVGQLWFQRKTSKLFGKFSNEQYRTGIACDVQTYT